MAKTETATVGSIVSITVNGKTVKMTAKDALIFAWRVIQAAECAVEEAGEAYVVLDAFPNRDINVHGSALQELVGAK
jgi:hypothetical protein